MNGFIKEVIEPLVQQRFDALEQRLAARLEGAITNMETSLPTLLQQQLPGAVDNAIRNHLQNPPPGAPAGAPANLPANPGTQGAGALAFQQIVNKIDWTQLFAQILFGKKAGAGGSPLWLSRGFSQGTSAIRSKKVPADFQAMAIKEMAVTELARKDLSSDLRSYWNGQLAVANSVLKALGMKETKPKEGE